MTNITNFIIWNGSPNMFSLGPIVLRWYAMLFILGFVLARIALLYFYKKESKPTRDAEILTRYIVVASIIGARLGYVLLYQPALIWREPFEIFLPIAFQPTFHFTGLDGLSSHGAIIGILIALWIYRRKNKSGQLLLEVSDRVFVLITFCSIFISLGSFFNSEVDGIPFSGKTGFVFTRPITDGLQKIPCCIMRTPGGENPVKAVHVKKDPDRASGQTGYSPILLYLFFKPGATEQLVNEFLIGDVKSFLYDNSRVMFEPGTEPLHYTIFQEEADSFTARIRTIGIARHPTQLYESIAFLLIFLLLFWNWSARGNHSSGSTTGLFLISTSALVIASGFLREDQVAFEGVMQISIRQMASLPLMILGIGLLLYSHKRSETR